PETRVGHRPPVPLVAGRASASPSTVVDRPAFTCLLGGDAKPDPARYAKAEHRLALAVLPAGGRGDAIAHAIVRGVPARARPSRHGDCRVSEPSVRSRPRALPRPSARRRPLERLS